MRPILRPGLHLLRRGDHELQLGLDPHSAVVLPDTDEVRGCMSKLAGAAELSQFASEAERATLGLLESSGLVVDSDRLLPLIPVAPRTPPGRRGAPGSDGPRDKARRSDGSRGTAPRGDVAAMSRWFGDDAPGVLRGRRQARVGIETFGGTPAARLRDEIAGLLERAGVGIAAKWARGREPTLVVLVGVGEPQRETVDPLVRDAVPHVVVRLAEGWVTIGPFVAPGDTACLRCIDAHHTDADPSWPLLVAQYAALTQHDRSDGVPEPVDSLTAALATSWAARDAASYAEGRRPSSWSATIRLDPGLGSIESHVWLMHPGCGCAWK